MSRIVAREKAFQLIYLFEVSKDINSEDISGLIDDLLDGIHKVVPEEKDEEPEKNCQLEQNLFVETEADIEDIIKDVLQKRMQNSEKRKDDFLGTFNSDESGDTDDYASILGRKHISDRDVEYVRQVVNGVFENRQRLDELIATNAKTWKLYRIPIVDLSILRLALYEILYLKEIPIGVSINESVEIAKKFSDEDSPSFINGVLGAIVRSEECLQDS